MLSQKVMISKQKVISFLAVSYNAIVINMNKFKWPTPRNSTLYICFAIMKRALQARLKALVGQMQPVKAFKFGDS